MEIIASDFARICEFKSAHNIYMQVKQGKLTKNEGGKYNIFEPLNMAFLSKHGKSRIDVENYLKEKETKTSSHCRPTPAKNTAPVNNEPDQSDILFKCVDIVIDREYSTDEAKRIKKMIFGEMGKRV